FDVNKPIKIPKDSKVTITPMDIIGTKALIIHLGSSQEIAQPESTLPDSVAMPLTDKLMTEILPLKTKIESAVTEVTQLAHNMAVLTSDTLKFRSIVSNLNTLSGNMAASTQGLDKRLKEITESAASIMNNFKKNNDVINRIMTNSAKMTDTLAANSGELRLAITNARRSMEQLDTMLISINSGKGSVGKLMKDEALYNNLTASAKSLDNLLIEFKEHPKRFVHFSVFGRKDKPAKK
ncbi:MAG: hypothetical protein NZ108_02885, partial [Bacteroidia bacterium]|nr:hypothetical protein [Bacteroidia bacterium]